MLSMTNSYYVYSLFRETGEPFYIGKGKGPRWLEHARKAKPGRSHKDHIILEMSRRGFTVPAKKLHENLTHEEACELEIGLIALIGREPNGPLVNMTDGGEGIPGLKHTEKTKELLRAANTGKVYSIETRTKQSTLRKGKKRTFTPEQIAAYSAKMIAYNTTRVGSKRSPETRANISASLTGRKREPFSDEWKAKIGDAQRGKLKPHSEAHKEALRIGKLNSTYVCTPEHGAAISKALKGRKITWKGKMIAAMNAPEHRKLKSDQMRGRKWINNGSITRRLKPGEELPDGWVVGRKPRK